MASGLKTKEICVLVGPPAILLVNFVWFFWSVRVPFWDQFSMTLIFDKFYSSGLSFSDFWEPYNGHRIPIQRLLSLGLGSLTHWNVALEAVIPNVLNVAIFAIVLRELRSSLHRIGAACSKEALAFFSVLFFSLNQYENWFNGWDIQVLLAELCAICALLLVSRPCFTNKRLLAATGLAVAASFSFGAGLSAWPAGLVGLWFNSRQKWRAMAFWLLIGAVTASLYLAGARHQESNTAVDLIAMPGYLASYLGSPMFSVNGEKAVSLGHSLQNILALVAPTIGVIAIVSIGFLYHRVRNAAAAATAATFPLLLITFAVVSGGLTAFARTQFGRAQAMSPHYISVSRFLWVGVAMLYLLAIESQSVQLRRRWRIGIATTLAAMLAISYANGFRHLRDWRTAQLLAQDQLSTRYDDVTLRNLCPVLSLEELHRGAEALRRNRLALFAGSSTSGDEDHYVPSTKRIINER
jgi:hypothetical protein